MLEFASDIRLQKVRGPYHSKLTDVLKAAKLMGVTQEAIAAALSDDTDQTTVSKRLSGRGGTFDLDEADLALRLCGSCLKDFVNEIPMPRRVETMKPIVAKIVLTLRGVDDRRLLQGVLKVAKSAREIAGPRKKPQSTHRLADGGAQAVSTTAARRRRHRQTTPKGQQRA